MYYTALSVAEAAELGGAFSAERWAYAGRMTLIGMMMIFSVLATLWGVLFIFKLIFAREKKKVSTPEVTPVPQAAEADEENEDSGDEGELIAVITAAVAAYRASEEASDGNGSTDFRVVSFRRANGTRPWNRK